MGVGAAHSKKPSKLRAFLGFRMGRGARAFWILMWLTWKSLLKKTVVLA